ncbi:OLC1v1015238C1 [Oldenlandia corymbosa var. corymbosa]|uniref:1-phosphatidylinositol-3-phosphate 5-kinase n=1 Tax=Oldenlandia corymbosa var. corymbosa TaxID=529605 RepID=A0AAV1E2U5_OLDCO|nr:OLC1v1015238C1 [Oldenlandia corymbosa var. corymbosa]
MDAPDSPFPDLVNKLKSWIRRSEPANVSRDFWMPDQSCRVCYECDSQFTLFNRRHHCRHCGRVFCAKCTSNWIPASSSCSSSTELRTPREEWEKIRVCNYCFKQWKQGLTASAFVVHDGGVQGTSLDHLSISPSTTSFISSKSSGTVNSSSITIASMPQSDGVSPHQSSAVLETAALERQTVAESRMCKDFGVEAAQSDHQPPISFGYSMNRNSDDDDEFGVYRLESKTVHFPNVNGYYGHMQFDEITKDYSSRKVHPDAAAVDSKSISSSPLNSSLDSSCLVPEEAHHNEQKGGQDISDECEPSSSLIPEEDVAAEPVDFENNGVLWLPPEPEDEEDEREALLFDDDDEGDAAGEWGQLRSSSSFGSGEFRSREKSNEEHKRAVKNVVDGHFRALVAQLLQVENLYSGEEDDKEGWLEIITSLSWEAATLLKPDMSKGGGMDPGGYVKVKCIASGRRSDSMVVKGVVCKKNVAHRRMTSKIEKPRILILGGALEYQRVSNLLSSFDTLLQQEMDHLKMAVARIDSHNPDVLLVEKSVSRYAQEYLLAKDISLVLNIKRPLLERIARCTGGQIVPSIDSLSSPKLGYCDLFHVERFLEEHGSAGQGGKKQVKTLMYFEGCPKPLGCTILLKGASEDELKKVKHVVQYGVFAAYHVALETSFLADEGASLPELPLQSPITVGLPDKPSTIDRSISTVPGFSANNDQALGPQSEGEPQRSISLPSPKPARMTNNFIDKMGSEDYSNLTAAAVSESIKQAITCSQQVLSKASFSEDSHSGDQSRANGFVLSDADEQGFRNANNMLNEFNVQDTNQDISDMSSSQVNAMPAFEEPVPMKDEFPPSPSDHQSILVTLSSRCVWKGTVCERSHLFRIKYYGNFDKPLGRFLRDHLFDPSYRCRSCEMPSEAHVQCYTHRQGTLTISVKKLPEILLPGERDGKIWMWHRCLKCPRTNGFPPATRRIVMSDAAWGLSFGKFLELSFSNHAAASRVASCGHSLHRDCLRFYGFGKMVACFRYASIDVHSVYLPPPKLDFNFENQEWIQKEVNEVVGRAELLFSEVLNALRLLVEKNFGSALPSAGAKIPESRRQITDLEGTLQKEKAEFEDSLEKILKKDVRKGQPVVDIFEINRLRRQLIFQSYLWDQKLIYASSSGNLSPAEKAATSFALDAMPSEDNMDSNVYVKTIQFSASVDLNLDKIDDRGVTRSEVLSEAILHDSSDDQKNLSEVAHKEIDTNSNPEFVKCRSVASSGIDFHQEPDLLEPNLSIRRVLSDGQFPTVASLSDTLDAAWTGENHPGVVISVDSTVRASDTPISDSSTGVTAEKLDMDNNHFEDLAGSKIVSSPLLSSRSSDTTEDSLPWLGIPFISFYRSWNKSFLLGNTQKLDPLTEYNPVYISSFRDAELQGGARLLLPLGINDTVIPVYDDEPTSAIAFALASPDYVAQLSDDLDRPKDFVDPVVSLQSYDSGNFQSFHSLDEISLESYRSLGSADESILSMSGLTRTLSSSGVDPLSYTKAMHARISFTDDGPLGKVKYTVTCYYAKRFEALRRVCCPSEMDFIRSLSRCKKWGAQGGKSNVFFAKTLDDRFIIKQVTKTELESFIKFAPGYFKYLSESIGSGSPTCLAKILGIYQVTSKHFKGGKESKMDVLVMENLLFGRNVMRLYDLKGSSRSRYNPDSSGSNKVLLDQNLIEAMPTSPIFVGNKAKRLLERAVWNDTAFLASIDVMDYSLLVGVDQEKHELVLGIIDFMRQYTWDKHLETWAKASGILGGPKNASPTVISPKQYKKRFRKAMTTYFLMVPDQWSPPSILPSKSQTDLSEENLQGGASTTE